MVGSVQLLSALCAWSSTVMLVGASLPGPLSTACPNIPTTYPIYRTYFYDDACFIYEFGQPDAWKSYTESIHYCQMLNTGFTGWRMPAPINGTMCAELGLNLVAPDNKTQNFYTSAYQIDQSNEPAGGWYWGDNLTTTSTQPFDGNEAWWAVDPNNTPAPQTCATLRTDGTPGLRDVRCADMFQTICEYRVNPCDSNPCPVGATCLPVMPRWKEFTCDNSSDPVSLQLYTQCLDIPTAFPGFRSFFYDDACFVYEFGQPTDYKNYDDSVSYCQALNLVNVGLIGWRLPAPYNATIMTELTTNLIAPDFNTNHFYTSAYQIDQSVEPDQGWYWGDNVTTNSTQPFDGNEPWHGIDPNNSPGQQACAIFRTVDPPGLKDVLCSDNFQTICEYRVNPCDSNPCPVGATCLPVMPRWDEFACDNSSITAPAPPLVNFDTSNIKSGIHFKKRASGVKPVVDQFMFNLTDIADDRTCGRLCGNNDNWCLSFSYSDVVKECLLAQNSYANLTIESTSDTFDIWDLMGNNPGQHVEL